MQEEDNTSLNYTQSSYPNFHQEAPYIKHLKNQIFKLRQLINFTQRNKTKILQMQKQLQLCKNEQDQLKAKQFQLKEQKLYCEQLCKLKIQALGEANLKISSLKQEIKNLKEQLKQYKLKLAVVSQNEKGQREKIQCERSQFKIFKAEKKIQLQNYEANISKLQTKYDELKDQKQCKQQIALQLLSQHAEKQLNSQYTIRTLTKQKDELSLKSHQNEETIKKLEQDIKFLRNQTQKLSWKIIKKQEEVFTADTMIAQLLTNLYQNQNVIQNLKSKQIEQKRKNTQDQLRLQQLIQDCNQYKQIQFLNIRYGDKNQQKLLKYQNSLICLSNLIKHQILIHKRRVEKDPKIIQLYRKNSEDLQQQEIGFQSQECLNIWYMWKQLLELNKNLYKTQIQAYQYREVKIRSLISYNKAMKDEIAKSQNVLQKLQLVYEILIQQQNNDFQMIICHK